MAYSAWVEKFAQALKGSLNSHRLPWGYCWLVFCLGIGIRGVFLSHMTPAHTTGNDAPEYDLLAYNLVTAGTLSLGVTPQYEARLRHLDPALDPWINAMFSRYGRAVEPSAYRTPGYPAFLAAHFMAFGWENYTPVRITQTLLDALLCVLVMRFVAARSCRLAGISAGLLLACSPFLASASMMTQSDSLGVWLCTLGYVLGVLALERAPGRALVACAALCLALAALTRPQVLLWPLALILATVLLDWKKYWQEMLVKIAIIVSVLILTWTPWLVRNYRDTRKICFTTTTPLALYKGSIDLIVAGGGEQLSNEPDATDEERLNHFKQVVLHQPVYFIKLGLLKTIALFHPASHLVKRRTLFWRAQYFYESLALGLAVIGVCLSRDRALKTLFLCILFFHVAVVFLTISDVRFRLALAPAYYLLAGIGLAELLRRLMGIQRPTPEGQNNAKGSPGVNQARECASRAAL